MSAGEVEQGGTLGSFDFDLLLSFVARAVTVVRSMVAAMVSSKKPGGEPHSSVSVLVNSLQSLGLKVVMRQNVCGG